MAKSYIRRENLALFIDKMWSAGFKTEINPQSSEIIVTKAPGEYIWIEVCEEQKFEDLIASLTGADNQ